MGELCEVSVRSPDVERGLEGSGHSSTTSLSPSQTGEMADSFNDAVSDRAERADELDATHVRLKLANEALHRATTHWHHLASRRDDWPNEELSRRGEFER